MGCNASKDNKVAAARDIEENLRKATQKSWPEVWCACVQRILAEQKQRPSSLIKDLTLELLQDYKWKEADEHVHLLLGITVEGLLRARRRITRE